MIRLREENWMFPDRKSSKGNQLKFERDGIWYKADYMGYEGLAEYTVSQLLCYSTLKTEEFVQYEPEQIAYEDSVFNGCSSRDFLGGWQLITLERLFQQLYGKGLNSIIYAVPDHTERLKVMAEQVERATGIRHFGEYLAKLLTIDVLFLNEDRHTHNIAVMTNDRKEFRLCPVFDNGACLLSDTTMDYPLGKDCLTLMKRAKPKTFCDDFSEQMDITEALYGEQIRFTFGYHEVQSIVDRVDWYSREIRQRVIDLVMSRRNTYQYLFDEQGKF